MRDGELHAAFYYGNLAHPSVSTLPLRELAFRIVVPSAWGSRLAAADWPTIAAEPWLTARPISTHHVLATELFAAHGIEPLRQVEADHEAVINSLVAAGVGIALMREDTAIADAAAGHVAIWGDTRLSTRLQFVSRRDRDSDPAIHALRDVAADVWATPAGTPSASTVNPGQVRIKETPL